MGETVLLVDDYRLGTACRLQPVTGMTKSGGSACVFRVRTIHRFFKRESRAVALKIQNIREARKSITVILA